MCLRVPDAVTSTPSKILLPWRLATAHHPYCLNYQIHPFIFSRLLTHVVHIGIPFRSVGSMPPSRVLPRASSVSCPLTGWEGRPTPTPGPSVSPRLRRSAFRMQLSTSAVRPHCANNIIRSSAMELSSSLTSPKYIYVARTLFVMPRCIGLWNFDTVR